jgi:hypothetical protein
VIVLSRESHIFDERSNEKSHIEKRSGKSRDISISCFSHDYRFVFRGFSFLR